MTTADRYAEFDYSHLIDWTSRLAREWPFLERAFADVRPRRLLDLGSGTGEHSRFLAEKGFEVVGIDASPAMLAKSREASGGAAVRFVEGDMREAASLVEGPFGGAICLGNALPHLREPDDIARLAAGLRKLIVPGGAFVTQLINYDRIEAKRERALPLTFLPDPADPQATIVFLRTMELLPDGRVLFMPTRLRQRSDLDPPLELIGSRRVEIRGWRRGQLERTLREAGFADVTGYGSYDGAPFDPVESRDVILVAR